MGFAVEKLWDARSPRRRWATSGGGAGTASFGDAAGGPSSCPWRSRAGARIALFARVPVQRPVPRGRQLHGRIGIRRPTLYFLAQYLGVAIESSRPPAACSRATPGWVGRGPRPSWSCRFGLLLHPGLVDGLSCADAGAGRRSGTGTLAPASTPGLARYAEGGRAGILEKIRARWRRSARERT